jgi:hypothetical protein
MLLGWDALRPAAAALATSAAAAEAGGAGNATGTPQRDAGGTEFNIQNSSRLQTQLLPPQTEDTAFVGLEDLVPRTFDSVAGWAKESMALPRQELERHVLQFQRHFSGGKGNTVCPQLFALSCLPSNVCLSQLFACLN